ncbi:MAG TPA: LamG-like jellyroll fold domain-containing protein [Verrucomicrobiae bacterium]|jgi:hypothetical protein
MTNRFSINSCLAAIGLALAAATGLQAQTFSPIPLTPSSFTQEIVIPVDWTYHLNAQSVSVTLDAGPQLQTNNAAGFPTYYSIDSGDCMFEIGMNRSSANASNFWGMPVGGSTFTNATLNTAANKHVYTLGYWTNSTSNCLCLCNYTTNGTPPPTYANGLPLADGPYVGKDYTSASLTLNNANPYTALSFLVSAGSGPVVGNMTISFADGTTQTVTGFGMPDWFNSSVTNTSVTPNAIFAYTCQCRGNPAENQNNFTLNSAVATGSRLWSVDVSLSDSNSPATNISLTYTSGGRGIMYAVSGSSNPQDNSTLPNVGPLTGPFAPISVSGFNAGSVVANSPQNAAGLSPLTATMDNGTNIAAGGNTFFEKGWDLAAPTNGFPIHNSVLQSGANPQRFYQMPASYHAPMCVLVDTNHQQATVTLQNPGIYTALSFLTCGASIGSTSTMTNYCIIQHSDGVNESNLFFGYDWFNGNQPFAYIANERCNIGSSTSTIGRDVQNLNSTDPRLFESEFQTTDYTPITNVVVGYLQAPSANSTTYVIALSGTTNFIPVDIATNTLCQNVYAGNNAVFSMNIPFGSTPIVYQWQFTDGASFTNNLSDGATGTGSGISGSATTTLTVTNVSSSDKGYYTCHITNPAGTNNSPLAPLTLLVSTATNVVHAGDAISDSYGASFTPGEAFPTPAGLTVPNVIDGTLAAYLNYGDSGTNNDFVGPISVMVTPSTGRTIVNALRFVVAANAAICDPADYSLDGSVDGINWTNIVPDTALNLSNIRNLSSTAPVNINNQILQEVTFPNTGSYIQYRVTVQNVKNFLAPATIANSMQIAEIQFLGALASLPPGIFTQPAPATQNLEVGGQITWSVAANGPGPITYQWYQVAGGTTNLVSGATSASYTFTASLGAAGSYFVTASNAFGTTNSTFVTANVIAPSSTYISTVIADGPASLFRLDEGPDNGAGNDGVIAYDSVGGHNGYYSNVILQVTGYNSGDTDDYAAQFGLLSDPNAGGLLQDNCVAGINGVNFFTPTNTATNMSIECWVNLVNNTVAGAGIVSKGFGGGGEEFALDTGGTGNAFRFYFRNNGAASFTVSPNVAPLNSTWYHVVGVLNETNNVEYIYTNGLLAATTALANGSKEGIFSNDIAPILIGARSSASTTNFNLQLNGIVDNVAIYHYALSAQQVANHYLSIGVGPAFTVTPTNLTVLAGQAAPAVFNSSAFGTSNALSPLVYHWSYNGVNLTNGNNGTDETFSGANTPTLTITGYTVADNGQTFTITATNNYGNTSAAASFFVAAGAPVVFNDVQTPITVFVGTPLTLSATFTGTVPFGYQWMYNGHALANGGRISGATNNTLNITPTVFTDSGTYQLRVTNVYGTNTSSAAVVTVLPVLTLNGFGENWSVNSSAISSPAYPSANTLELTDGGGGEARSSFFSNTVYVGAFQATFTYTDVGGNGANADGACFVLQDDPRGAAALGGGGGSLGYSGITPSISLQFNLYVGNVAGGVGVGFATGGTLAEVVDPAPVVINYGDPINVTLNYIGGVASLFLQDANNTNLTYSAAANVNIPAVLGTNQAFVGFTGATGGTAATQTVSDFQFISLVDLTAQASGGNITLSWPVGSSAYQLESNSNLGNTNGWANVAAAPIVANGQNQVTVPMSAGPVFYRLQLQ